MNTIEIEGTLLDTEDGVTTVTAELSDVIEELELFGYTVVEDEGSSLDLIDSLLLAIFKRSFRP